MGSGLTRMTFTHSNSITSVKGPSPHSHSPRSWGPDTAGQLRVDGTTLPTRVFKPQGTSRPTERYPARPCLK